MILALALAASAALTAREVRLVMGTTAEVRVGGLAEPAPALDAAFGALALVDDRLSLFKESELARLNREGRAKASAELLAVLRHALDVAAASSGAFDPTVEPLVRAAGGLGDEGRSLGNEERRPLLASVGCHHVHLDPATGEVRLDPGTRLDFGGIAKGYAVDLALAAVRGAGAASGLVDLGGSSLAAFGERVVVEIRDPIKKDGQPWAAFELRDGALGTSGGDQRPGHILDPRTGLPARRVLSATVVAGSAIEADALSTAVYVLGAEEGLALLRRRGAEGLVLLREGGRSVVRTTPGFAAARALRVARGVEVRP